MKIIGAARCFLFGHQRGKLAYQGTVHEGRRLKTYKCARCGAEWRRKVKAEPEQQRGAPSDGSAHYQETAT